MFRHGLTACASLALISVACGLNLTLSGQSNASPAIRQPRTSASENEKNKALPAIEFENIGPTSRIKFELRNSVSPQRYTIETMVGGVALFDYNNDGLLDIFFSNGAAIPSLAKTDSRYFNRLYRNNGDGTFTDVTTSAHLEGKCYSMGVAAGDYDNDGNVDLYVAGYHCNQLFHNNGDGTFTDVTDKAGVTGAAPGQEAPWSITAGWFDYNNDGKLDLLVVNYLNYDLKTATRCSEQDIPAYCSPVTFLGTANVLYRNNGDGTFTDVSQQSHISQYVGKGMGVSFADYDSDGYTDIFVSNDTFQNYLLHNNRDGTFTEVGLTAGVAYNGFGNAVAGMGTDFRDLDNDGKPDIFETAMFGEGFPIFHNLGDGQFQDATGSSGMTVYSSRLTAWGTGVFDFDNDGLPDLFTANADILDNSMQIAHRPYALPNGVFRNKGNLTFEDLSGKSGMTTPAPHRAAAFGDLNNDGKIDAVVLVMNGPPEILMNRTRNTNHWITLKLVGVKSNRDGLGTRAKITTAEGTQFNHATTAVGYNGSSDKRIHFGLGKAGAVEKIELWWPSGIRQTLSNVKADQILTITEAAN